MTGTDWRVIDGVATAWFDAPTLLEGSELARRVLAVADGALLDVRSTGVRVRGLASEQCAAVSDMARELGLRADPATLQQLSLVLESADPPGVQRFWRHVLHYDEGADGELMDPLRRDATVRIQHSFDPRPVRGRIHLDVVRPGPVVADLGLGEGAGPYGVRHADPDGTEVDLVSADPLGESVATADWQVVWGAMAAYRVTSPEQQAELASKAATLADDARFPLLIDLRPGFVVLDTGKDQGDPDAHGLDLDFTDLAAHLQSAARDLGATADPSLPRLVQIFLDAADITAVRAFWTAALGYVHDRRDDVSDIHDPRRLNPVTVFQQIDISETDRRRQRNRVVIELAVPGDVVQERCATAVAAGGRMLDRSTARQRIADPEGNELVLVAPDER